MRQAMFVDFGMAEQYGGECYLRYDDTNPEAEKLEFIEHIQDIVAWLGWKPAKARARPTWERLAVAQLQILFQHVLAGTYSC